ncbi:unnamed protein product [Absidia cylindrospora]
MSTNMLLDQDSLGRYLFGPTAPPPMSLQSPQWPSAELQPSMSVSPLLPDLSKQHNNTIDYCHCLDRTSPVFTATHPIGNSGGITYISSASLSSSPSPSSSSSTASSSSASAFPVSYSGPLSPPHSDMAGKPSPFRTIASAPKDPIPTTPTTHRPFGLSLSLNNGGGGDDLGSMRQSGKYMDENDLAIKRQKNTDAARRSRFKKLVKMERLETRIKELEADKSTLATRIAVLESETAGHEAKETRIRTLESQLAEAYCLLATRQAFLPPPPPT